jgi:hypothetical protein
MKRHDEARQIDQMIRSAQTDWQDAQAIVEAWERQEDSRHATRHLRTTARHNFEQLMLRPEAVL